MAADGGWFQTRLGEGVAIVVSILIAFGIDAGWDEWQQRDEEAEILEALRDEFEQGRTDVQAVINTHLENRADITWLSEMTPAEIRALSVDEVGRILPAMANPWTFDPYMGTTDALLGAGQLTLLRDRELRQRIVEFVASIDDAAEDERYIANSAERVWDQWARFGGPWLRTEVELHHTGRDFGDMSLIPNGTPEDVIRVWGDEYTRGLVRQYQLNAAYYVSELESIRDQIDRILELLPGGPPAVDGRTVLLDPEHPAWSEPAPDTFRVRFETTAGPISLEVYREWAPVGADRFWNLARHGFYDDARFHRVVPGFITQFGISGDPEVDAVWYDRGMPDDTVVASNVRGTFAYAFTDPGTRSTQLYVNMVDNIRLDSTGFAPIGRVVYGMGSVVDRIFGGYGEESGGGVRRGAQGPLVEGGNAFIDREYPELDRVLSVRVER